MKSLYNDVTVCNHYKTSRQRLSMHKKNIKLIIKKQLKSNNSSFFKSLGRKKKKELINAVADAVKCSYDFSQDIEAPVEELLGIEDQTPTSGIISLADMAQHIEKFNSNRIFKINRSSRSSLRIQDKELRFVDKIIDDEIINKLLAYEGYTPCMRTPGVFLANLFRAELLKTIKFPEISYRKFCTQQYMGMNQKENRVFMGLSLNNKQMIDHTKLSKFRFSLTFTQQVNLLVYFLHYFEESGLLGDSVIHAVDSTDLANDCKSPLAVVNINGIKICIYNDLDCDCGKRRKKRNKSDYFIGYRLHTLTAINSETGHSFPIASLLAPANHHDSNFLIFLVKLAQAMGIDLKLVTADEAYHDKDGAVYEETGVIVTTPPSSNVKLPENIDSTAGHVFVDDKCEIPMCHVGSDGLDHEYKCGAEPGQCFFASSCPKYRIVPFDGGLFQRIPSSTDQIDQANDIRKNCERPFNLLKNQTGLEVLRVRSQQATMARVTFATIGTLLIEMAGFRKKKKKECKNLQLFDIAM
jgi:hypothetical protein